MPISIAYHASQEQFAPSHLLSLVQKAEEAGFDAIHSSDHFHPWSERQGHSGYTFSWIAAAMQATSVPFSMVCAPGQRYHPAIVAQAIATIAEMFPGRYSVELGSGEALNEMITGDAWPDKDTRNRRLLECVNVIRELLSGEEVTHEGLISVKEARLYSLPDEIPPLFCAAISEPTSAWAGGWADGLLTTAGSREDIIAKRNTYRQNGGTGKPFHLQYSFSYAPSHEEAVQEAHHQWRSNLVTTDRLADLYKPAHFDKASEHIGREEVSKKIDIITDMNTLFERIEYFGKLEVNMVILHNVSRNQEKFIDAFARIRKSHNG